MDDLLDRLVDEELFYLAEDLKMQLEKGAGTRPVVFLLSNQRQRAAKAIRGIVNVDPTDAKTVAQFQQEARLYFDLIEHCREMLNRGREADRNIDENERIAFNDAIVAMPEEERRALNIEPRGND